MNISEVKTILPVLMRNRVVPFLWGSQGVGKTQTVKQIAKDLDLGFVHLHAATQEAGDLVGLLIKNDDGTVKHARPAWFPTEGKGIIFLDELNRMQPDVMQALFSFITEGTIHTHQLPDGWRIVAAGNYQSDMFQVTDTSDAAWMSRFCHIDFKPTKDEFVMFAEGKKAYNVADFIRNHPELLEAAESKHKLDTSMITFDRRSLLDFLAPLDGEPELDNVRYEIYSGIVGPTVAASYLTYKKNREDRLSGRDVLNRYESVQRRVKEISNAKSVRFDVLDTAVEEILLTVENKATNVLGVDQIGNLRQFLLDMPLELGLKVFNKLNKSNWKQKKEIVNNVEFVSLFQKKKLAKEGKID